jgi:hypothetical protein
MTDLSARARLLVDSARKEATPSAEQLQHLRARLSASLAGQSPDPVMVPFSLSKLAGVLALAAVGLGGWYLRGAFTGHDRAIFITPSAVAPAPAVPPAPVEPAFSCPPAPTCDVPVQKPVPVVKTVVCAPPAAGATVQRDRQHELFSVEAAQKDPSMELELLILARVALDDDRAMDALGHALRHEQLYPHSAFEEERLAIEVLAWCSAENPGQALPRLKHLLELAPETTYLPRIRGACGEDFVCAANEPEPEP